MRTHNTWLRAVALTAAFTLCASSLAGCGAQKAPASASPVESGSSLAESGQKNMETTASPMESADAAENGSAAAALPDGVYTAAFDTDSSMFHTSEACGGRGTLTVQEGSLVLHVSLASKKIVNLYPGTAEQAQADEAGWLEPTTDTVTFSDGLSEEVYGFDIPVPVLDEEFDLALLGTKGVWYDHKVVVSDPQPKTQQPVTTAELGLADGVYTCEVTLEGGSGRSGVLSPAELTVQDGAVTLLLTWNSPNYDYMVVEGETFLPINESGDSVFALPAAGFDVPLPVTADTVAMSTPHEIEYTLTLNSATLAPVE